MNNVFKYYSNLTLVDILYKHNHIDWSISGNNNFTVFVLDNLIQSYIVNSDNIYEITESIKRDEYNEIVYDTEIKCDNVMTLEPISIVYIEKDGTTIFITDIGIEYIFKKGA